MGSAPAALCPILCYTSLACVGAEQGLVLTPELSCPAPLSLSGPRQGLSALNRPWNLSKSLLACVWPGHSACEGLKHPWL